MVCTYDLNNKFVKNVKNATASQIGYVRTGARERACKPWWNEEIKDARRERKRLNKVCRQLRKRRHEREEAESKYQNAWTAHVSLQGAETKGNEW